MSDHYVILADHGHLRIFQQLQEPEQMAPSLREVQALDFPRGRQSYVAGDTDIAGRFQGSKQNFRGAGAPTARTGMSIDERLPEQLEDERRTIREVAERSEAFLKSKPDVTWDFAGAPTVHNSILEEISPESRGRLGRSVAKDLIHQPAQSLLSHF